MGSLDGRLDTKEDRSMQSKKGIRMREQKPEYRAQRKEISHCEDWPLSGSDEAICCHLRLLHPVGLAMTYADLQIQCLAPSPLLKKEIR